jgi:protein phosphatase
MTLAICISASLFVCSLLLLGFALRGRRQAPKPVIVVGRHWEPKDLPRITFDEDMRPQLESESDLRDESCPVLPIAFDEEAAVDEDTAVQPHFVVKAVARTDPGRRRSRNEDNLLVRSDEGLCVLADGMGGQEGGGVASELAVETIASAISEGKFADRSHPLLPVKATEVVRAIQMASSRIREEARATPALSQMGTTVVAARFSPCKRRLYIGHVGDSRCYRFRGGELERMTNDHTMAALGVAGPGADLLSRAVGTRSRVLTDLVMARPEVGDVYLMCSDGLTKMVPDDLIRDVLDVVVDLKRAADWLVELANTRGGHDNISVVLVRVEPAEQAAA